MCIPKPLISGNFVSYRACPYSPTMPSPSPPLLHASSPSRNLRKRLSPSPPIPYSPDTTKQDMGMIPMRASSQDVDMTPRRASSFAGRGRYVEKRERDPDYEIDTPRSSRKKFRRQ